MTREPYVRRMRAMVGAKNTSREKMPTGGARFLPTAKKDAFFRFLYPSRADRARKKREGITVQFFSRANARDWILFKKSDILSVVYANAERSRGRSRSIVPFLTLPPVAAGTTFSRGNIFFAQNGDARLDRTSQQQNGVFTASQRFPILVCGSDVDTAEGINKGQYQVGGQIFKKPEGLRALRLH